MHMDSRFMFIMVHGLPKGSTLDSVRVMFLACLGVTVLAAEPCGQNRRGACLLAAKKPVDRLLLKLHGQKYKDSVLQLVPWANPSSSCLKAFPRSPKPNGAMLTTLKAWYRLAHPQGAPAARMAFIRRSGPSGWLLWCSPQQLPRVHAVQVAAALRHWELPRNLTHGDRSVVLCMLRSPPPTFAALFPYLVGHEYHTRSGRGDLLYTNGWGVYAVLEAKQLCTKGAKARKQLAQRQAQRYAADVRAGLTTAAVVIPFIVYLAPVPRMQVLGKRKRQAAAASQQEQNAAASASPSVTVELVPMVGRKGSSKQIYRVLESFIAKAA